ncbi:MAG TPA: hypothetical protein ENK84_04730 [Desulfobulbus sp.]|nr:hypothetical protein [Desulfobulbus sp.]
MEPVPPPIPSLRVDRVKLYQGNRQQQSPFSRGKVFQGVITGKNNNRFILDVEGQQWIADTKAPLRIGQRLNLQVTGTKPQVTLQILTDPLTQKIGKSLHLLTNEGRLLPGTLALAGRLPAKNLSAPAKDTLNFYSSTAASFTRTSPQSQTAGNYLAELLTNLIVSTGENSGQENLPAVSSFLENLLQTLPEQDLEQFQVQSSLTRLRSSAQDGSVREMLFNTRNPAAKEQFQLLLQTMGEQQTGAGQTLVEALVGFFADNKTSAPTPLLFNLLSLTAHLLKNGSRTRTKNIDGPDLQQFIERLGTNLEHLLAAGKKEEAAKTLKSTLLEISHNLSENKPLQQQADQLTSTLELFQLLQIRLAGESAFVLPLPLPFLNQGFLLVEPDQHQSGQEQQGDPNGKKYSLHLQLEGLGNLRIELQQQKTGMRIRFFSQDAERTQFVADHRQELGQWLTAAPLESVQFLTGADEPIKELLSHMADETTGVLDTSA